MPHTFQQTSPSATTTLLSTSTNSTTTNSVFSGGMGFVPNASSGSSSNSNHQKHSHDMNNSNSSDGAETAGSKDLQSSSKQSSKKRRRFSPDEDQKILTGVSKFFDEKKKVVDWDKLVKWSDLNRTKEQIRNRYGRIKPKGHLTSSSASNEPHVETLSPIHAVEYESELDEPASKKQKTIQEYVVPMQAPPPTIPPSTPKTPVSTIFLNGSSSHDLLNSVFDKEEQPTPSNFIKQQEAISSSKSNMASNINMIMNSTNGPAIAKYEDIIQNLRKQIEERDHKLQTYEKKSKDFEQKIQEMTEEHHRSLEGRQQKFSDSLIDVLTKLAEQERKDDKIKMNENSIKIGTISYQKTIGDAFEVWQDGDLFIELDRKQQQITAEREKLEKQKKQIQKTRLTIKKEQSSTQNTSTSSSNNTPQLTQSDVLLNDLNEQEEIYKLRLNQIKKEEANIQTERERLTILKSIQIREIKRIRDQERSRFKNPTLIQKRYFLMKLLGRGGFSEVYKAYDLLEFRIVACKIHQINPNWKEHRKENYIRHVLRECQIHKSVKHPRLIQMFDTFILDNNTFVTVLEYCDGFDLDLYIKKHQRIPEKEARNIIAQVFSGLAYLNQQKQKIIHFDLKPANILFTDGQIKITDFGLSKIMEEEDSIELTSQGAGTYWYLPPECFDVGKTPMISPKVDVWSAGVVFYQMLFGKKPFGNDLSQQKILSEQTIVNAKIVQFPPKPAVSDECKEFIRKCLTYNPGERPDVVSLYNDKYLRGATTSKK